MKREKLFCLKIKIKETLTVAKKILLLIGLNFLTFVKSKGSITFINHIKNLPDILSIFAKSMGDVNVTPIFTDLKTCNTLFNKWY